MSIKQGLQSKNYLLGKRFSNFRSLPFQKILYKALGGTFIILSILFLYNFPFLPQKNVKNPITIDQNLLKKKTDQQAVRIIIPNVGIDLPIVEAPVVNGYWELSETKASHGEGSANPGEKGNMVIFAHARPQLFLSLKDAKKGNTIYVLSKKGWEKYRINVIKAVYPNQTEVIKPTKTETLTLFTCSGFLDEKRLIVQAKPVEDL